jgi:hypothetical protein
MILKFININFISYLFLYGVLFYVFSYFIYPVYFYEGYILNINYLKIFISILIIFIVNLILPSKINKVSDFLLHIQFIFPIISMLVLYSAENLSSYYMLITIFCFLIIVGLIKLKTPIKYISIFTINISVLIRIFFLISLSILILLATIRRQYFTISITNIYEYRILLREIDKGIYPYLWHSVSPVLLSILFSYSLIYKRRTLMIVAFLFFIFLFAFSTHKQYLFLPFMIFGIYLVERSKLSISKLIAGSNCLSYICTHY